MRKKVATGQKCNKQYLFNMVTKWPTYLMHLFLISF